MYGGGGGGSRKDGGQVGLLSFGFGKITLYKPHEVSKGGSGR